MKKITLYSAKERGNQSNCYYPKKHEICDISSLHAAVSTDYVCAAYKDNYRNASNFIESDVLPFDCDNDHSDDKEKWITVNDIRFMFPNVCFYVHFSRNNMKEKKGRIARPKFHVFFPIKKVTDEKVYRELKESVGSLCAYFDQNALDSARFFFGTEEPEVQLVEGELTIDEFLDSLSKDHEDSDEPIVEGNRNSTLSKFAARVLIKCGISEEAHNAFLEKAGKCEPPLEDRELNLIWYSAKKFYKEKVLTNPNYIPPQAYKPIKLKPDDYSDIGQAKALIYGYQAKLVYTDATGYLYYSGKYWDESKQLSVAVMEDFLDKQLLDAETQMATALNNLKKTGLSDADIMSAGKASMGSWSPQQVTYFEQYAAAVAYKKFVMKRRDMKYVTSALDAAKPMVIKDINALDKNPYIINTPDGTIDLINGNVKSHDKDDLITKITTVGASDKGKDLWESSLNLFFNGDKDLIEYVQQVVGLASIGCVQTEMMIIAYGDGRNGKSTFWNTISKVLGSYSGSISADTLTVGCRRNVKPEMAELKGKRLVIAAELEEGMRLNTSIVKQLSSTDDIAAEKKFKDPFKFTPSHLVVLYTNHLPRVGAIDDGTWRRLVVIPFNAKIEGKSDIKNYSNHLYKEAGEYVMKWIIEGAIKVMKLEGKPIMPPIVQEAVAKYRKSNDWIHNFLDECCDVEKGLEEKSGELYTAYRNYCQKIGEYARSTNDFYSALELIGHDRKKKKAGMFVSGLKLKEEELL